MKLPKQWKHWLRTNGFKWTVFDGRCLGALYPRRNGRYYRVNCFGYWQIDDGDFDRWGNSLGAEVLLPQSRQEFINSITWLEEMSKEKKK